MIHLPPDLAYQLLARFTALGLHLARQFRLTPHQLTTLVILAGNGPSHFKDLRQTLDIPKSTLTFTLDGLQRRRLVSTRRDPRDRRQWLVALTKKGTEMSEVVSRQRADTLNPLFRLLEDEGNERSAKLLEEMRRPPSPGDDKRF